MHFFSLQIFILPPVGSASQGGRTTHPSLSTPLIRGYVFVKAMKAYGRAETAPFIYHPEHQMEDVLNFTPWVIYYPREKLFLQSHLV